MTGRQAPLFGTAAAAVVALTVAFALTMAFTFGLAMDAGAETTPVPAVRDNTLYEDAEGSLSNGKGAAFYVGDNARSNTRRGLVRFDVSSLPPDAVVTSVELRLTLASAPDTVPRAVAVHRVLADWGEGASASGGQGAPAEPGDATWRHRFAPDSLWAAPGGDFDAATLASSIAGETGIVTWSGAALVAAVRSWLQTPEGNFGWMLRGEEGEASSARSFHSRESPQETARPVLLVEWDPEPASIEAGTWGSTKARYRPRPLPPGLRTSSGGSR